MAGDLKRRVAALETGNGTIGIGEMLDHVGDSAAVWGDPSTSPDNWRGKVFDPRVLRALDALPPGLDRLSTDEVEARIVRNGVHEVVEKGGL